MHPERSHNSVRPEPAPFPVRPEPVEGRTGAQPPLLTQSPNGHIGHGLIGMRERVAMLHGTLEVGPQPESGYAVRATIPLQAAAIETPTRVTAR